MAKVPTKTMINKSLERTAKAVEQAEFPVDSRVGVIPEATWQKHTGRIHVPVERAK